MPQKNSETPMMQQYHKAKNQVPDCFLLFRLGDFFELFFDDAKKASKLLGITLTQRKDIPMCGVPVHVSDRYIKKILDSGQKVAICDQVKLADDSHGNPDLMERKIVEIITPGAISNSIYLAEKENNFILCVHEKKKKLYAAWIDISIGEISLQVKDSSASALSLIVGKVYPKEILLSEKDFHSQWYKQFSKQYSDTVFTECDSWTFSVDEGRRMLCEATNTASLRSFGITDENENLLEVISSLLHYVQNNAPLLSSRVVSVHIYSDDDVLEMDPSAIYNLELLSTMREGKRQHSLLGVLDRCNTVMGSRFLQKEITAPSRNKDVLNYRYDLVSFFIEHNECVQKLESLLDGISDLTRLQTRIITHKAHAKDVYAIGQSTKNSIEIYNVLKSYLKTDVFDCLFNPFDYLAVDACSKLILDALTNSPPIHFGKDYVIKEGYDLRLDELRNMSLNEDNVLNEYLMREQTNIQYKLRLRQNKATGYYFEFPSSMRDAVPKHMSLRQSLTSKDRYKTDELIAIEIKVLDAKESLLQYEISLFEQVSKQLESYSTHIYNTAKIISFIDVIVAFSKIATQYNYVRPELTDDAIIDIDSGKHCVVDSILPQGEFIPNDIHLNKDSSMMMITGPNMAGKSTFLRQNALIVIMAHLGSFVPAKKARMRIFDKVFCRVGASDNMAKGESTFLMEMSETAYILYNATSSSLVLMDEVGRGTSIEDGMAIAQSVTEYLLEKNVCTLFATHYHNITDIEHEHIKNYAMQVKQDDEGRLTFLHKIAEGVASNSYGIEVARIAGVPTQVIDRAYEYLDAYSHEIATSSSKGKDSKTTSPSATALRQALEANKKLRKDTELFSDIKNYLRNLQIESITPLESMEKLLKLLDMLHEEIK